MYYIEINNKINQIVKTFERLGMWPIEDESKGHRKVGWKLFYLIFHASFGISAIIGGLLSDHMSDAIFLFSAGIALLVASVKLTYILRKKKEICSLIRDACTHSVADYEVFVTVNDKGKDLITFSHSLFLIICVSYGLNVIFHLPIFSSERNLPLNIWFPFDWKNNAVIYWTAFAYVSMAILITIITISLNVIIWYLMMNCAIKYQIVENQFSNMFLTIPTIRRRKISKLEEDSLSLQELVGIIKSHQNIQE